MSNILGGYLLPHPPIILEEIGRGEEKKLKATIDGMENISKDIISFDLDLVERAGECDLRSISSRRTRGRFSL